MVVLNKDRWGDSQRLTQYCFRDNSGEYTRWYYDRRVERVFALLDSQDCLAAQAVDSRVSINVRGSVAVSSMISHVATDPAHRSKGLMKGLLTDTLRLLRGDGVVLAALYPSAYSFYELYGFAACGNAARVVVAPDRLRARPLVNRLCWDTEPDISELAECYAAAHSGVSGSMARGVLGMRDRIDDLVQDGANVGRLYRDESVVGYWIYRDDGYAMTVDECAFRDASARMDFLSYLASHSSTIKEARLRLPVFEPLLGMFPDRHASVTVEPWAMFRAVDLPGLAGGLRAGIGRVMINVIDDQAPDNAGQWRFEARNGRLEVSRSSIGNGTQARCKDTSEACTLGIGAVTQWLLGSADGSSLMDMGQPIPSGAARAMDELLPAQRVFLWEQC